MPQDKQISELTAATALADSDLFVLQQSTEAKKAPWSLIKEAVNGVFFAEILDTESSAIEAAYQAGKTIFCYGTSTDGNIVLPMTIRISATDHRFGAAYRNASNEIVVITAKCTSDTWSVNSRVVPAAYTSTPAALGTASAGSSTSFAKGDHVHAMPTAANVGAIPTPSSPSDGQFLVYSSSQSAWVAQTVPTANGVSF
ncbi:MAG: hypothetical protein J5725_08710 [Bacteroidales bacterium]|nr:hypothetical protein [Bacteroidales bacterium]